MDGGGRLNRGNFVSLYDHQDSTCQATGDIDYYADVQTDFYWDKLRVGVMKQFLDPKMIDAPVLNNFKASLDLMSNAG